MKHSTIKKYLLAAGVPSELHDQAISCISLAKERAKGLAWIKWKTRVFYTKKISKLIPWEAERLIDVKPELAYMDIAPMINITAHGDNALGYDSRRWKTFSWLRPESTCSMVCSTFIIRKQKNRESK